jgi:uncharacterized protein
MATVEQRTAPRDGGFAVDDPVRNGFGTRVVLQPIAAPSLLGLFGFAAATFMVGAWMAGWYGSPQSPGYLFPFASMCGGVAQLIASAWSFKARDGIAVVVHGMWGSFWLGFGILQSLFVTKTLVEPKPEFHELAFWFIALSLITVACALAALANGNFGFMAVLTALACGAAFAAVYFLTGGTGWKTVAGWVLIGAAGLAYYVGTAMLLEAAAGRVVLPLGKAKAAANRPGDRVTRAVELAWGEPGIRQGQ